MVEHQLSKLRAGVRFSYPAPMTIGIMCAKASFSEEDARTYMKQKGLTTDIEYLVSAERMLTALEAGDIDLGIFAIENSNGGIVIEAVHAMAKHRFKVKRIFEIDVHQNLLVKPGVNADQITSIT